MKTILAKMIAPTILQNSIERFGTKNPIFNTRDYIYLESKHILTVNPDPSCLILTDYAIMNKAYKPYDPDNMSKSEKKFCCTALRSDFSDTRVYAIDPDGNFKKKDPLFKNALRPVLSLSIKKFTARQNISKDFYKIDKVEPENGASPYYVMYFGEFPRSYVGDEMNKVLEKSHKRKTGKTYAGCYKHGKIIQNQEYVIHGERYVRVLTNIVGHSHFSDGSDTPMPSKKDIYLWCKVEPVRWIIRNWQDLPQEINPNGLNRTKFIDLKSEEAILSGISFYPIRDAKAEQNTMWQNSVIRALFNGYNLYKEIDKGNGNKDFKSKHNFNFKGHGLIDQMFTDDAMEIKMATKNNKSNMIQKMTTSESVIQPTSFSAQFCAIVNEHKALVDEASLNGASNDELVSIMDQFKSKLSTLFSEAKQNEETYSEMVKYIEALKAKADSNEKSC